MKLERLKRWRSFLVAGLLFVGIVVWLSGWPTKYLNWWSLTGDDVARDAARYIEDRFGGGSACIYEVRCDTGRAQLYIVEDLNSWDIEATKDVIWNRRFSDECPGRTANIGLHVLPDRDLAWSEGRTLAIWTFGSNRFIPTRSRYSGGAFSEGEWQHCSLEHSTSMSDLASGLDGLSGRQ